MTWSTREKDKDVEPCDLWGISFKLSKILVTFVICLTFLLTIENLKTLQSQWPDSEECRQCHRLPICFLTSDLTNIRNKNKRTLILRRAGLSKEWHWTAFLRCFCATQWFRYITPLWTQWLATVLDFENKRCVGSGAPILIGGETKVITWDATLHLEQVFPQWNV